MRNLQYPCTGRVYPWFSLLTLFTEPSRHRIQAGIRLSLTPNSACGCAAYCLCYRLFRHNTLLKHAFLYAPEALAVLCPPTSSSRHSWASASTARIFLESLQGRMEADAALASCSLLMNEPFSKNKVSLSGGERQWKVRTLLHKVRRKTQHTLLNHVQEHSALRYWLATDRSEGAFSVEDLIELVRCRSMPAPGESDWLVALAIETDISKRLWRGACGYRYFPPGYSARPSKRL